jgi:hypothetical protein
MKQLFRFVPPGSSNSTVAPVRTVKGMRRSRVLTLFVVVMMLLQAPIFGLAAPAIKVQENEATSVGSVSVNQVAAQCNATAGVSAELVERLINQIEGAQDRIEAHLASMEGASAEAVKASYDLGLKAVEEARRLKEEGNCSEAADSAVQAIRHFKDALINIQENTPSEVPQQIRESVEENLRLRTAIERAQAYLERLREAAKRFAAEGHDVSRAEGALDKLEGSLETASSSLADGELGAARRAYAVAEGLLIGIKEYVSNLIEANREARVERYLNQVQSRIEGMDATIIRLTSNLEAVKVIQVRAVLDASNAKIISYKERLAEGKVDEVVSGLKDTVVEIDYGLDALDGTGTSLRLKAVNELWAKLQTLRNTAVRLANEGRDSTRVRLEIHRIEVLLEGVIGEMEKGDNDAAQELLEDAAADLKEGDGSALTTNTRIVDRIRAYMKEKIDEAQESKSTTLSPTD